jgi:hypothetical protein
MAVFLFEMSAMYALIVLYFRLGYQLIFLIGWVPADFLINSLLVGMPADFLYSLGLSVSSGWDTS